MSLWKKGKSPLDAQDGSQNWEELSFDGAEFEDEEYTGQDDAGDAADEEYAQDDAGDAADEEYAQDDDDVVYTEYAQGDDAADMEYGQEEGDTAQSEDFDLILTDEDFEEDPEEGFVQKSAGDFQVNEAAFGNIALAAGFSGADAAGEAFEEESFKEDIYEDTYNYEAEDIDSPELEESGFGEGLKIMDLNQQAEDEDEENDTFGAFLMKLVSNKLVAGASLLALVIFLTAAVIIVTGRGSESVDAFTTVSSDLEDVDVIGGQALAALMDNKDTEYQATLLAAEEEETASKDYEETEETTEKITVKLVMTSVEKDLKIKFTNASTGKLIANIPFKVKVVDSSGNVLTWTNDDKDGIIYKSGLAAGSYQVSLIELEGELYEKYDFSDSGTVTVRDTIAYEKVDVSAEIKEESEINVASEEAQVVLEVESVNTDTVEWVESTKTLSSEEYTLIDKTLIAVPTASAVTRSFLATAITNDTASMTLKEGETGSVSASSDVDGAVLTYESSDKSVASVSDDGTVTAVAEGSAEITITETVTNEDGSTAQTTQTCSVTVSAKANETDTNGEEEKTYASFTLSASSLTLTKGGSGTVSVTASGATEGESLTYEYTSSNTSVATVSGSGSSASVTAVSTGTATITIKAYYQNKTDVSAETTCTVTVSQSYADFTLSLSSLSLSLNKNGSGTVTVTAQNTTSGESITYTYTSSDTSVAEVYGSDNTVTVKGIGGGTATITVSACYKNNTSKTASATFTVTVTSSSTALKTTDGKAVYVLEDGSYRTATYDDYYTDGMAFYVKSEGYTYTGWQTIDGKTYYYTAAGNYVVGEQVIQGVQYTFSSTGVLQDGSGTLGIDVSSHNGSIDWTAVKNSGVSYAIIRCGYRGYGSGVLVEDSKFRSNIQGAINAGLKVGVYFFSQAVTTTEAVEEASMVLQLISGYSISLPVYIDVEYSNSACDGRADSLSKSERTAIVKAFCQTIQNSGYTAGIYANKTWLTSYLDMSQLSSYRVWLAQYAASPTYSGSYHMWQYTSSGSISGISGNVDLNLWYY